MIPGQEAAPAITSPVIENTEQDVTTLTDAELAESMARSQGIEIPKPELAPEVTPVVTPEAIVEPAPGAIPTAPVVDVSEPIEENPDVAKAETAEELKKSLDALTKQHQHLQQLNGRLSNEVGQLRKEIPPKPTQEDFDNDSVKATEQLQKHNNVNQQIGALEQEAQLNQMREANAKYYAEYVPDLHANARGISDFLVNNEGMTPVQVNQYMGNLHDQNPLGMYMLNARYKDSVKMAQLEAKLKALTPKPNPAAVNMVKINRQEQVVTSAAGANPPPAMSVATSSAAIARLSDKELKAQLANSLKQEHN